MCAAQYVKFAGIGARANGEETMRLSFKKKATEATRPIRHTIVKMIAPKIYYQAAKYEEEGDLPRPTIQFVRNTMNNEPLTGAEIGVAKGFNAESILKTLNIKKLYLVDPYIPYKETKDGKLRRISKYLSAKEEAVKRLSRFQDKTQFICLTSDKAVDFVPKGLNFVYIDGNHSYEYVKKDIMLYYPLVKAGGALGGHDYSEDSPGVIKASNEFAAENNLKLYTQSMDWWIIKTGSKILG